MSVVVKITFYESAGFFGKKNLFEIFKVFSLFLHFVRDVLCLSVGKKWNACQNSNQSKYTEDQISLKIEKNGNFQRCSSFSYLQRKAVYEKHSADLSKVYYTVNSNFLRKSNFFEDLFFSIWDFECKFYALWQNKLSEVVQNLCTCPDFFWQKCFFIEVSEVSYHFVL